MPEAEVLSRILQNDVFSSQITYINEATHLHTVCLIGLDSSSGNCVGIYAIPQQCNCF